MTTLQCARVNIHTSAHRALQREDCVIAIRHGQASASYTLAIVHNIQHTCAEVIVDASAPSNSEMEKEWEYECYFATTKIVTH